MVRKNSTHGTPGWCGGVRIDGTGGINGTHGTPGWCGGVRIYGTSGTYKWYAWYARMVRMVRWEGTHGYANFVRGKGPGWYTWYAFMAGGCGARVNGTCRSMDVSNVKVNEEHYGTRGMVYGIQ